MNLQTLVNELLVGRTHRELADLVPCSTSQIGMLASGDRGKRTSYLIENRLRVLHARQHGQQRTQESAPC
jgi:hypothetical protein